MDYLNVNVLLGKVLTEIQDNKSMIIFHCESGEVYKMFHEQGCCETVEIEDIEGDLRDLIGNPILMAEEVTNEEFVSAFNARFSKKNEWDEYVDENGERKPDSFTWTFYKFATIKGYVTVRWFGESNGYYCERVDFMLIKP